MDQEHTARIIYAPLGRDPEGVLARRLESMGFAVQVVEEDELAEVVRLAADDAKSLLVLVEACGEKAEPVCAELREGPFPVVLVGRGAPEGAMDLVRRVAPVSLFFESCDPSRGHACLEMALLRWRHEQELMDRARQAHAMALKEIHHRVKNHLNVVQSFLHLQEQGVGPECREQFVEARQRIRAVAVTHDLLAHPESLNVGGCQGYLDRLVSELASAYGAGSVELDVFCDVDIFPRQMVPLGLIVTELVTNALRHGLAGRHDGRLVIRMEQLGDRYKLAIHDNGPGLPDGF
ncbi:MAG: sensor histidine kinase, partial [Desulfovibrionaceae bacterium]